MDTVKTHVTILLDYVTQNADIVSKFHSEHVSKDLCDRLKKNDIFYFGLLQLSMTTLFLKLEITVFVIHGSLLLIGWDGTLSDPIQWLVELECLR